MYIHLPLYTFFYGEGNGNPFQYFCLENSMVGGTWQATVHGVAKSQPWMNTSAAPSSIDVWGFVTQFQNSAVLLVYLPLVQNVFCFLFLFSCRLNLEFLVYHLPAFSQKFSVLIAAKYSIQLVYISKHGSPNSRIWCLMIWGGAYVTIIQIKCTINVMCFNHFKTIPPIPRSMEKLSSTKLVPGPKKFGDFCFNYMKN